MKKLENGCYDVEIVKCTQAMWDVIEHMNRVSKKNQKEITRVMKKYSQEIVESYFNTSEFAIK